MKELSRFEMAIVKRTAKNTKALVVKRNKLVKVIADAQEELKVIEEAIEGFEAPVKKMTGGYTSEQVLGGLQEVAPEVEVEEVDETAVAEVVEVGTRMAQDIPEGTNEVALY